MDYFYREVYRIYIYRSAYARVIFFEIPWIMCYVFARGKAFKQFVILASYYHKCRFFFLFIMGSGRYSKSERENGSDTLRWYMSITHSTITLYHDGINESIITPIAVCNSIFPHFTLLHVCYVLCDYYLAL